MNISVRIDDLTVEETSALNFAMNRFNMVRGQSLTEFDIFLAEFLKIRILPRFANEEKATAQQEIQQAIRSRITITSPEQREALKQAVDTILPALEKEG